MTAIARLAGLAILLFGCFCGRAQALAPPIRCQITLQGWCIVFGAGQIKMSENGWTRTWEITPSYGAAPYFIKETSLNCAEDSPPNPRKINEREERQRLLVTYSIADEEGCDLEFSLPTDPAYNYRSYIETSVWVGGKPLGLAKIK
jgi:hypothetical protein